MKKYKLEFTLEELWQIRHYLADHERNFCFYGRRDYFDKRQKSIWLKIDSIVLHNN